MIFTETVDAASGTNPENYAVSQFTYEYSGGYGSPEIDHDRRKNSSTPIEVAPAALSADRMRVSLSLKGWRAGYVTAVRVVGGRSAAGRGLWHDTFYYTLNHVPE